MNLAHLLERYQINPTTSIIINTSSIYSRYYNNSLFIKYNYVLECSLIMKLIYENGRFFKKKNKKLIEVNKYGVPIVKTDAQLVSTKRIKTKGETSLVEGVVDVATTKEGMATIGGATAGGWFGSSVGLAGFWGRSCWDIFNSNCWRCCRLSCS